MNDRERGSAFDENMVTLSNWVMNSVTEEDRQRLFYRMSKQMKSIHEHGGYLDQMNPYTIRVSRDGSSFSFPIEGNATKELREQNIFDFACLSVAAYANCFPYINEYTNIQGYNRFMREHYEEFATFLPEKDTFYFKGVIQGGDRVYYSDFRDRLQEALLKQAGDDLDGAVRGSQELTGTGRARSYSTPQGRLLSENETNDLGNAAFMKTMALPALLFTVLFLGSLLVFGIYFSS